jgi:hypothetical protein
LCVLPRSPSGGSSVRRIASRRDLAANYLAFVKPAVIRIRLVHAAVQILLPMNPAGKSAKTCPAPFAKIF